MRTRFQEERERDRTPLRRRVAEGFAFYRRVPFLRTTLAMIAVSNFTVTGMQLAVIVLARQSGLSSSAVGLIVASVGAATLVGALVTPLVRRVLPMRAILLSEFWTAAVYAAFIAYPSVYVLAAALAVHAFWFPNTDSAMEAYSYTLIPDRLLGRAMAASNTLRAGTAPLGPLLAGLLLAHASPRLAVLVLAGPVVVAAALGTLSPALRNLPSLSASPAAAD
jgi:MFS family permease